MLYSSSELELIRNIFGTETVNFILSVVLFEAFLARPNDILFKII